jgi:2-keto-3-deoxy-galactonokinase
LKVQAKDSATTLPEAALVGVDWGTTQRRVYALDSVGALLQV